MSNVEQIIGQGALKYPNTKSYFVSSGGRARSIGGRTEDTRLRKGKLYSVKRRNTGEIDVPGSRGLDTYTRAEIDTKFVKEFQFNPPELNMSLSMSPVDGADTELAGGNVTNATIGQSHADIELLFDRTQEVYNGSQAFGKLGVAKDILDVFGVIKGSSDVLTANTTRSIAELSRELTDLVATGSEGLLSSFVAVAYSEDFIIYGIVTSMYFRFVKWSNKLIPVTGYVNLGIDIHNAGNTALVNNAFGVESGGVTPVSAPSRTTGSTALPARTNTWNEGLR